MTGGAWFPFKSGKAAFPALLIAALFLPAGSLATEPDVTLLSQNQEGVLFDVVVPGYSLESLACDWGTCDHVTVESWGSNTQAGFPELPSRGVLIQVPAGADVTVETEAHESSVLTDISVCPVPTFIFPEEETDFLPNAAPVLPEGKIPFEKRVRDMSAYDSTAWIPEHLATAGPTEILRGNSVVRVMIKPFQWNPSTQELRIVRRLRVRVKFGHPFIQATQAQVQSVAGRPETGRGPASGAAFESILDRLAVNRQQGSGPSRSTASFADANSSSSASLQSLSTTAAASGQETVKLEINEAGLFRVTYTDLVAVAPSFANVHPDSLHLSHMGNEAAMTVITALPEVFAAGDSIEFFARGVDTTYTDTTAYWLELTDPSDPGKRPDTMDGTVTGTPQTATTFRDTLQAEQNPVKWPAWIPGADTETDHWFWARLAENTEFSCVIDIPDPVLPQAEALLRVNLRGRTTASHHTQILLNGTLVGDDSWSGAVEHLHEEILASGLLAQGANTVTVRLPGDAGVEDVYLDWIELDYTRRLILPEAPLIFTLPGEEALTVEIAGFPSSHVLLYEVTDPFDIHRVEGVDLETAGDTYTARFLHPGDASRTYVAATASNVFSPKRVSAPRPEGLTRSSNRADYVLITPREFFPAVWPLLLLRWTQGHFIMPASVEAIYDNFNHGQDDPVALQDFLRYAYASWQSPAPSYVSLAGDANVDYRNYSGTGKANRVPPHSSYVFGLAPNDGWFGCVDGDDELPDMNVGRISGENRAVMAKSVWKILRYEIFSAPYPPDILFISDKEAGFESLNERLIEDHLPEDLSPVRVYRRDYENNDAATNDIVATLNSGAMLTSYAGHGATTRWGSTLLSSSQVPRLTGRDHPGLMMGFTCLSGYFDNWAYYGFCETLFRNTVGGPIGSFSASSLTYTWEHVLLSDEIFSLAFGDNVREIGALTTPARVAAYLRGASLELVQIFNLIGDPATRLKDWQTPPDYYKVSCAFDLDGDQTCDCSAPSQGFCACTDTDQGSFCGCVDGNLEPSCFCFDATGDGLCDWFETDGDKLFDCLDTDGDGACDCFAQGDGACYGYQGSDAMEFGCYDGDDNLVCGCADTNGDMACDLYDHDRDGFEAVPVGSDCDDTNPGVHPDAEEICNNGADDDCNGKADLQDPACGLVWAPSETVVAMGTSEAPFSKAFNAALLVLPLVFVLVCLRGRKEFVKPRPSCRSCETETIAPMDSQ